MICCSIVTGIAIRINLAEILATATSPSSLIRAHARNQFGAFLSKHIAFVRLLIEIEEGANEQYIYYQSVSQPASPFLACLNKY